MKITKLYINLLILNLFLASCAPQGRYYQRHDSAPKRVPDSVSTDDANVKFEPYAPANLRPYSIRGITYRPMFTGKGYSAKGQASWYGMKFHGHLTSNGEIYDMYQMSAAHKTLPLPSFVRVTNVDNGKQVVVRVNDRGPFHDSRLIDLSYAAALKLDMLKMGVANIKLDVVHVDEGGNITIGKQQLGKQEVPLQVNRNIYLQVAALSNKQQILKLGNSLKTLYRRPFKTQIEKNIYKLHIGPLNDELDAQQLLLELRENGYPSAYRVFSE
jgi:rare lipoprotein A